MSAAKRLKRTAPEVTVIDDGDDNFVEFLHSKVESVENVNNVKEETLPQPQYLLEMAKSNRAEWYDRVF